MIENKEEISKLTAVLTLSIIVVIIAAGAVYFLIYETDNEDTAVVNTSSTIDGYVATKLFSSQGLSFQYPEDFNASKEQENLPEGNEFNVYVSSNVDEVFTDTPQVSISIYQNSKKLSIPDFIDDMKSNSVVLLLGSVVGAINESYEVNTRTIGSNQFEEYIDKTTSERTAFCTTDWEMVVVSELGAMSEIAAAYNLILNTLQTKGSVGGVLEHNTIDWREGIESNTLHFPEAELMIKVPKDSFSLTDEELSHYNNKDIENEYYLMHACRTFFKELVSGFGLWVSFDEHAELCGTDRFMSGLSELPFQTNSKDFCSTLNDLSKFNYASCRLFNNPPDGYEGFTYYQFIFDYGGDNTGIIVREVYLRDVVTREPVMIIGYAPKNENIIRIQESEFEQYISRIESGEFEFYQSDNSNVQTFELIVRSLSSI